MCQRNNNKKQNLAEYVAEPSNILQRANSITYWEYWYSHITSFRKSSMSSHCLENEIQILSWTVYNLTNLFFYLYPHPLPARHCLLANKVYASKTLLFSSFFWNTFLPDKALPIFQSSVQILFRLWGLPQAESTILFLWSPRFLFIFFQDSIYHILKIVVSVYLLH